MARATRPPRPPARGFTLIELFLVVAVLGVLLAVAFPSFQEQLRKGRRAEAFAALAQVQQAQERWRASQNSYSGSLSALGLAALASGTPDGLYTVAIDAASASAYRVTATASGSGAQASDTACQRLRVEMNAGSLSYLSACAGCGSSFTAGGSCWSR